MQRLEGAHPIMCEGKHEREMTALERVAMRLGFHPSQMNGHIKDGEYTYLSVRIDKQFKDDVVKSIDIIEQSDQLAERMMGALLMAGVIPAEFSNGPLEEIYYSAVKLRQSIKESR